VEQTFRLCQPRSRPTTWCRIGYIIAFPGEVGRFYYAARAETVRHWGRQAERDQGLHGGLTSEEQERTKALEREVRDRHQANEILRKARAYFAQAELDRRFSPGSRPPMITAVIYRVEPIYGAQYRI